MVEQVKLNVQTGYKNNVLLEAERKAAEESIRQRLRQQTYDNVPYDNVFSVAPLIESGLFLVVNATPIVAWDVPVRAAVAVQGAADVVKDAKENGVQYAAERAVIGILAVKAGTKKIAPKK